MIGSERDCLDNDDLKWVLAIATAFYGACQGGAEWEFGNWTRNPAFDIDWFLCALHEEIRRRGVPVEDHDCPF